MRGISKQPLFCSGGGGGGGGSIFFFPGPPRSGGLFRRCRPVASPHRPPSLVHPVAGAGLDRTTHPATGGSASGVALCGARGLNAATAPSMSAARARLPQALLAAVAVFVRTQVGNLSCPRPQPPYPPIPRLGAGGRDRKRRPRRHAGTNRGRGQGRSRRRPRGARRGGGGRASGERGSPPPPPSPAQPHRPGRTAPRAAWRARPARTETPGERRPRLHEARRRRELARPRAREARRRGWGGRGRECCRGAGAAEAELVPGPPVRPPAGEAAGRGRGGGAADGGPRGAPALRPAGARRHRPRRPEERLPPRGPR